MKRKLSIIMVMMLLLTMLSAVPASAASGYKLVKKTTDTSYYRLSADEKWQKAGGDNPLRTKYSYNSKNDVTKIVLNDYLPDQLSFSYKYKNGRKSTMLTEGGSWLGEKVYYDKKGRRTRSTTETVNKKYKYNSRGYVSSISYSKPWVSDSRKKETWSYKYNGKVLKAATHKILKKNGALISRADYKFNSKGLPVKVTTKYVALGSTETTSYSYTYSKGLVKSVDKTEVFSNQENQYKDHIVFTYTNKKTDASRYRMMIMNVLEESNFYGTTGPGSWY